MITIEEWVRLIMNIDEGIIKCNNEIKQCHEDISALNDELRDLRVMREIVNNFGNTN